METAKAKIRRRRNRYDYRGCVVKATITDGVRCGENINIDYRRDYAEFLKQRGLLVYACNWHPQGDPRVMWYIQGTPEQLNIAIERGRYFNITKRDGRKNFSPSERKNMMKCTWQKCLMTQTIPPVISPHL